MKLSHILLAAAFVLAPAAALAAATGAIADQIHIDDLIVHDPAVLVDDASQTYYIYANYSPNREWIPIDPRPKHAGVIAYASKDLVHWEKPRLVFEVPESFWADPIDAPWAPEVHAFGGKYYLFVTFNDWDTTLEDREDRPPITKRASQILVGDSPLGPFEPFANKPHTPPGEMTLDGTFWIEDGQPWLVYCQEWIQTTDGLVKAIRLTEDLSATVGEPITLIRAGDVGWTKREIRYRRSGRMPGIVTDGPWLHRTKTGDLLLMWSSWSETRQYATAFARSDNGKLSGDWIHEPGPILQDDRGHGAIFKTFEGELRLVLHRYFRTPNTRVQIYALEDHGSSLHVTGQLLGAP